MRSKRVFKWPWGCTQTFGELLVDKDKIWDYKAKDEFDQLRSVTRRHDSTLAELEMGSFPNQYSRRLAILYLLLNV